LERSTYTTPAVPEQRIRRDLDAALVRNRKVGAQLLALSARSACRVAIKYSVALRIASAASRLLGFVAGREAAAGVFSLFLMSGLPSARGGQ
jgi:hypothetical protein